MIVIADSGSTKTDWLLINKKKETAVVQTPGLNPFFVNHDDIKDVLEKDLYPYLDNLEPVNVYFYGAGCASPNKRVALQNALDDFFSRASVDIESDLLGAARALYADNAGVVGVLGTGSSTCYYDGNKITGSQASLGYILGDEGSGAYIGKKLIAEYYYNKMPEHLSQPFQQKFRMHIQEILDNVYKDRSANRYLASFTSFAYEHGADDYIKQLVEKCFEDFFVNHIAYYRNKYVCKSVSLCGSIAFVFQEQLHKVAKNYEIQINKIEKSPLQGLLTYHKPYGEELRINK